jgi:hypothetical protein
VAASTSAVGRRTGGWATWMRYALIVSWALLIALTVAVGDRSTSWGRLHSDVAAGRVQSVRVVGALGPGGTGYTTVEVHWRRGLFGHETEVVQARPRSAAPSDAAADGRVVTRDVGALLTRLRPGLEVTRASWGSSDTSLWGWHVPSWLGLPAVLLFLATAWLVVNGPLPWRATRWAWFWLLASPLGVLGFLLLSGPTSPLRAPTATRRRLTGGRALLLSILLTWLVVPHT